MTILFFSLYGLTSILSYGYTFAFLQKEFYQIAEMSVKEDKYMSLFLSLCGPVSLFTLWYGTITNQGISTKHGLLYPFQKK